jgi:Cys-tRNA(Pro)/Cys-tRNA(Cys) deacylase
VAGQGTPATSLLAKQKVAHSIPPVLRVARLTQLRRRGGGRAGVPPERVFKTLVTEVDGELTVAVVPVTGDLELKALAAVVGGKRAVLAERALAERTTGYVRGGISPLGQRKRLTTVIDAGAAEHETVYVSAGRRGTSTTGQPDAIIKTPAQG